MSNSITENVKRLREERKLTQETMASILDVSRVTYVNIEAGKRDFTSSELEKLKETFGVSWSEIVSETAAVKKRNDEKFTQIYLYILKKYFPENGVPKTKLAKLLYLVDFTAYAERLEPMSGATYIHKDYGPVADVFFDLTDSLYEHARINIEPLDFAQMISATSVPVPFDLITDDDKEIIDKVCRYWRNRRTQEIVDFTHSQKPWKSCRQEEEIPYSLIIQEDPDHVYAPLAG